MGRAPGAIAIGVITPSAPVNCEVAWAAGTQEWPHAWGYCMEGDSSAAGLLEQRAIPDETAFGGPGAVRIGPCPAPPLPLLKQGDAVTVLLNPTQRCMKLIMLGRRIELRLPLAVQGDALAIA